MKGVNGTLKSSERVEYNPYEKYETIVKLVLVFATFAPKLSSWSISYTEMSYVKHSLRLTQSKFPVAELSCGSLLRLIGHVALDDSTFPAMLSLHVKTV